VSGPHVRVANADARVATLELDVDNQVLVVPFGGWLSETTWQIGARRPGVTWPSSLRCSAMGAKGGAQRAWVRPEGTSKSRAARVPWLSAVGPAGVRPSSRSRAELGSSAPRCMLQPESGRQRLSRFRPGHARFSACRATVTHRVITANPTSLPRRCEEPHCVPSVVALTRRYA